MRKEEHIEEKVGERVELDKTPTEDVIHWRFLLFRHVSASNDDA